MDPLLGLEVGAARGLSLKTSNVCVCVWYVCVGAQCVVFMYVCGICVVCMCERVCSMHVSVGCMYVGV